MHQSVNLTMEGTGWHPTRVTCMTAAWAKVPGDSDHSEDEASSWVTKATKPLCKDQGGWTNAPHGKPNKGELAKAGNYGMTIEQVRSFVVDDEKLLERAICVAR